MIQSFKKSKSIYIKYECSLTTVTVILSVSLLLGGIIAIIIGISMGPTILMEYSDFAPIKFVTTLLYYIFGIMVIIV